MRLYQGRHHDIFVNAHFAFAGFAAVIFTSVIGVVRKKAARSTKYFHTETIEPLPQYMMFYHTNDENLFQLLLLHLTLMLMEGGHCSLGLELGLGLFIHIVELLYFVLC